MKKENKNNFGIAFCFLAAFILWTVMLKFIDVQSIGPKGSVVGFATLNSFFHGLTGVNMLFYTITDWGGIIPLCFVFSLGILGLVQWIKRKSLLKVDYDILVLGGFYVIVMAIYLLFESVVINYRPILINGFLEASYPSSTTLLVLCVMPTVTMQFNMRIKNKALKSCVVFAIKAFTILMISLRLISGVHWFSDIVGGILLSVSLVKMYSSLIALK